MKRRATVYQNPLPPKNTPKKNTVLFAASHDKDRLALNGLHHSKFREWASDGFRLHWLKSDKTECVFCTENKFIHPNIDQIIPTEFKYVAGFDAFELRAAIVKAADTVRKEVGAIQIDAGESLEVTPFRIKTEGLVATETISCEREGDLNPITIGVFYKYIVDALDHCAPNGGKVYIKLNKSNSPIMLQGGDRYAMVMPMYIGNTQRSI